MKNVKAILDASSLSWPQHLYGLWLHTKAQWLTYVVPGADGINGAQNKSPDKRGFSLQGFQP